MDQHPTPRLNQIRRFLGRLGWREDRRIMGGSDNPANNSPDLYPRGAAYKSPPSSCQSAGALAGETLSGIATIRERVFDCLWFSNGLTPDEVATLLGLSILTVRPRCSELIRQGRIVDSGLRRTNESGRRAKVLTVPRSRAARRYPDSVTLKALDAGPGQDGPS